MNTLLARDIMTADVVTIGPEATLHEAATLMAERRVSGLPVVSADGELVGILSEADLIDPEKRRARLPRAALFGVYVLPEAVLREAVEEGQRLQVQDVMTRRVFTLPDDTPVPVLVRELLTRRINRVPILRDGRLAGIVSRADALRVFERV